MRLSLPVIQRFQLVDQPLDHRKPLVPEGGIGRIKAEGLQEFRMVLGAARFQKFEIFILKAGLGFLVDRIKRVHQAITEGIGINIEG